MKKTEMFAFPLRRRGLKALADMSAQNVFFFFYGSPVRNIRLLPNISTFFERGGRHATVPPQNDTFLRVPSFSCHLSFLGVWRCRRIWNKPVVKTS